MLAEARKKLETNIASSSRNNSADADKENILQLNVSFACLLWVVDA